MAKKAKHAPTKKKATKTTKRVSKPAPARKAAPGKPTPKAKAPKAKAAKSVQPAKAKAAKSKAASKPLTTTKPKSAPKATKPNRKPAVQPAESATGKGGTKKASSGRTSAPSRISMQKISKKNALRDSILSRKATAKPIVFSLDEVRAIAKTMSAKTETEKSAKSKGPAAATKTLNEPLKPAKPNHVKAASLADILGFNPGKPGAKTSSLAEKPVRDKYKRYHKLLVELRDSLTAGIELHSEETLKRSAKEDAGDLSSYGQHMADAGTDTFDRDFALSLVSSEQEALSEIEEAIKRIHNDTYGICEVTGKPIAKERLLAVPFTRYSAEAQKELERNRHRARTQAGLFSEMGEEAGKITMDEDGNTD